MNKRAIFGGRRMDNNELVRGFYYYNPLMNKAEIFAFDNVRSYVYQVHPDSVRQFTGFTDKNGKEAYEGDVFIYDEKYKYVIEWNQNDLGFYADNGDDYDSLGNFYSHLSEIIGNVKDDPELK